MSDALEKPIPHGHARFLGKNGYDNQLEKALDTLTVGVDYKVTGGDQYSFSTRLQLEGFVGYWNSVMFDFTLSETPVKTYRSCY